MARRKDVQVTKDNKIAFRLEDDYFKRLEEDSAVVDISPSLFARSLIMKHYQQMNARSSGPSYVQETVVKYSEMDNQTLRNIIKEELSHAIENMVLSDEIIDKFLNEMSTKALEKLSKK
jgi:lipoate-protein ligase A